MEELEIIEMLMEGGNSFAGQRTTDADGKPTFIKGEDGKAIPKAYAQKMDLTKVERKVMKDELLAMFTELNSLFEKEYGEPLWPDFSIVKSGFAFNGSSTFMFDDTISDEEFTKYKKSVGDVDVTIPADKGAKLFDLLLKFEDKKIANIEYVGNNKPKVEGHQINAVFKYEVPGTDYTAFPQVDFEFTDYVDGKPTDWAKFSHNSNWADIKEGFKGVNHKYAIINLARALSDNASKFPNVMIANGASNTAMGITTGKGFVEFIENRNSTDVVEYREEPAPKAKSKKAVEEYLALPKKTITIADFNTKTSDEVSDIIKSYKYIIENTTDEKITNVSTVVSSSEKLKIPTFLAFSVDRGVRVKFAQLLTKDGKPVAVEGKTVFLELSTSESEYTKNLEEIFELLFGYKPKSADLKKMDSFLGVIQLLKDGEYENPKAVFNSFLDILVIESLWKNTPKAKGDGFVRSQELERDSWEEDSKIKWAMVNYILKTLDLEDRRGDMEAAAKDYYDNWVGGADDGITESNSTPFIPYGSKLSAIFEAVEQVNEGEKRATVSKAVCPNCGYKTSYVCNKKTFGHLSGFKLLKCPKCGTTLDVTPTSDYVKDRYEIRDGEIKRASKKLSESMNNDDLLKAKRKMLKDAGVNEREIETALRHPELHHNSIAMNDIIRNGNFNREDEKFLRTPIERKTEYQKHMDRILGRRG